MTSLYSVMNGSSFVVCFGAKGAMFYALSLCGYRVLFSFYIFECWQQIFDAIGSVLTWCFYLYVVFVNAMQC